MRGGVAMLGGAYLLIACAAEVPPARDGGGEPADPPAAREPCRPPRLFGHRGTTLHRPENTLPAFAWALEEGGDGIEVDVRLSADREIVVIHDARTGRTSDDPSDRAVAELSLDQLKALDAGAWFDPAYTGTRIPTLDEVADAFPDAALLLDLKGAGIGPAVVDWLETRERREPELRGRTLLSAFDEALLGELHAALPDVPIVYYLDTMKELARAAETGASYLRIPDDVQSDPAHMATVLDAGYLPAVGGTYVQWNGSLGLANSMKKTVDRREQRRPAHCQD